jgi:hypothetical protein
MSPLQQHLDEIWNEHYEPAYRWPIPARYVIDISGIIRAADVNADYMISPEPVDTVKFLRTLKP